MILEAVGISSGYGRMGVLRDLSLSVERSDFLGILGHNGAGKTTLLKTIVGMLPTSRGSISLNGKSITAVPVHKRIRAGLGYVPQGREIFPGLTVRENLMLGLRLVRNDIDRVVHMFPRLGDLLDRPGGTLSGGEQQILALARCICGNPQVMLLDEPTEGVQPSIVDEMINVLQDVNSSHGVTIILVEQNLDFLWSVSKQVRILKRGQLEPEIERGVLRDANALEAMMM